MTAMPPHVQRLHQHFIAEALRWLAKYHESNDSDRYAKGVSDAFTMAARKLEEP